MRPLLIKNPWISLVLGLALIPVVKLSGFVNHIFNLLTTLVHECGHSLFAWFMGRASIPSMSPSGGGVAIWTDQFMILSLVIWGIIGFLAFKFYHRRGIFAGLVAIFFLYPFLAFTRWNLVLPHAGGMLLEITGSTVCFSICLGGHLERGFERPLYALWGWWMLINRGTESFLMLTDNSYRSTHAIYQSGLAAGMPHDVTQLASMGIPYEVTLVVVLLLCVVSPPFSMFLSYLRKT